MKSTKNNDRLNTPFFLSGIILILSVFILRSVINPALIRMADPVPGAYNFFVGEIQGDGKFPIVHETRVNVEPNTSYVMRAEVIGVPKVHMDIMSPGMNYDNSAQEMVIPAGEKKKDTYTLLFNSGNAPANPNDILLRVFFLDDQSVTIKSVNLLCVPRLASWISSGIIWVIAVAGLVSICLGFTSNHVRIGILILSTGFLLSLYCSTNPLVSDNQNYGMVARSLLSDSDILLNEFSERLEANKNYATVQDDGNIFNLFPLGPSIVLAPLYALVSIDPTVDAVTNEIQAGTLATALCFGGALSIFFFLASRFDGVGQSKAVALTFIFAFCSHQFSQHLEMFWSHNAVMPFILGALLALKSTRRDMIFLAGILLVFGYVMRPTAALLVPVVAVWLWVYQRNTVRHFIVGCFVAGIFVASMNLAFYGHLVSPYSQTSRLGFESFLEAFTGNLISPNRGLFVFMPWALFSMWGIWLSFKNTIDPFFRLLAVAFFLHLMLVSSFPHWWSGHCYGPRFLSEVMPMLVLLLLPVLATKFWDNNVTKFLLATTLVYSLLVQVGGITGAAGNWNVLPLNVDQHHSRVWDWSDMQLMRPLNKGGASAKP